MLKCYIEVAYQEIPYDDFVDNIIVLVDVVTRSRYNTL